MSFNTGSPPQSPVPAADAFVGRERELSGLTAALVDTLSGRGALFLIGGEPGIGKSALADEVARRATESGFQVLWGRCWEAGGAPAYWPWVQSLRACIRSLEPQTLRQRLGAGLPHLAHLLPEVRELFPDVPVPPSLESDAARFHLFDAVLAFLRAQSEAQPLLLVLDDLHAADVPSLMMLRFAVGELTRSPVLVLGLYREGELSADQPVSGLLADLGREQRARKLLLGGLSASDVARYVEFTTGSTAHRDVIATIHGSTEGNPLFVGEMVRLLSHEARLGEAVESGSFRLNLPPGIRQVIGQRMRHLSAECSRVLTHASVLGREFDLDALQHVSGVDRPTLLQMFDEAESARVVSEVPGALGRMRFAHALIRDVFYDDLTATQRLRLHTQVGEALEALCGGDLDSRLTELAHHFVEAVPGGEVEKAIAYARAAGDRAVRLLAFEEAARLYRMALRALELRRPTDPALHCELLLSLGDAQSRANEEAAGYTTFWKAAELARVLAEPTYMARAALGHGGRFVWGRSCASPRTVQLLREALGAMPQEDTLLRARMLARLAGALRDEPRGDERHALSAEALKMARRLGDPATLAYALDGRYAATWEPGNARERLAIATELTAVAETAGDRERVVQAHHYRLIALVELGDLVEAQAALQAKARVAEELRQPAQSWYVAVMRAFLALFEGRLEDGEELMHAARAMHHTRSWNAGISFAVQFFALRREQDRLDEARDLVWRSAAEYPVFPMFRAMTALIDLELGRTAEAREAFEAAAAHDFAELPWDCEWLFGTTLLAEVASQLGDVSRAATLYRLIEPYAGFNVVAPAEVSTGSAARSLGLLATTLSRWEEAERHFREAFAMNQRMGARPWAARTRYDHARMLLARDRPGDREEARELLAETFRSASETGLTGIARRASTLLEELSAAPVPVRRTRVREEESGPRLQLHIFRREGEYWSVQYERETFRLKDSKGLRYLACLLREPTREFHVLDLVLAEEGSADLDPANSASLATRQLGEAGAMLDSRAKAEYRERLRELEAEVEEARSWSDYARAARAEEEREFLLSELSRAVGLGGRDRRTGSASERARVNVTRAIKPVLRKIQEHSPALGLHLASTVRTGSYCSYKPDARIPIFWEL